MSIQQWPEHERPRERLINQGADSLSDAELLAIFLRTGLPGKSAVDLARDIILKFGNLRALNRISLKDWNSVPGLGAAKYAQLKACLEMARRCLGDELRHEARDEPPAISDPDRFVRFARAQIGLSDVEQFLVLALNNQLRMVAHKVLFTGTVNKTAVFPREVLRFAIEHQASRIMVAHNHPSNLCTPSAADDQLTLTLNSALALVDIELVDHLVVGQTTAYSYRQQGRTPYQR